MATKSQTKHKAIRLNKGRSGNFTNSVVLSKGLTDDENILKQLPDFDKKDCATYNNFKPSVVINFSGSKFVIGSDDTNKLVIKTVGSLGGSIETSNDAAIGTITSAEVYNSKLYIGDSNGNIHTLDIYFNLLVNVFNVTDYVISLVYNDLDDRLHIITKKKIRYINGATLSVDEFIIVSASSTLFVKEAFIYRTANFAHLVVVTGRSLTYNKTLLFFGFDYSKTTWEKSLTILDEQIFSWGVIEGSLVTLSKKRVAERNSREVSRVIFRRFDGSQLQRKAEFSTLKDISLSTHYGVADNKLFFAMSNGINTQANDDTILYSVDNKGVFRGVATIKESDEGAQKSVMSMTDIGYPDGIALISHNINTSYVNKYYIYIQKENVGDANDIYTNIAEYTTEPLTIRGALFTPTEIYVEYFKLRDDATVTVSATDDIFSPFTEIGKVDITSTTKDEDIKGRIFVRKFKIKNSFRTNKLYVNFKLKNGIIINKAGMYYKEMNYE